MRDGVSVGTVCQQYDKPMDCLAAGRWIDAPASQDRACPACKARALLGQRHGQVKHAGFLAWEVWRIDRDGSLHYVTDHFTRKSAVAALNVWIRTGETIGRKP